MATPARQFDGQYAKGPAEHLDAMTQGGSRSMRLSDTTLDGSRPHTGIILDVSGGLREPAAHHRAVRRQP
jgi:hypothetical protein